MSIYSSNLNTPVYDYVQRLDEISAELALRAAKAADKKRGISAIDARFARKRGNIQQADASEREAIKRNRQAMKFYSYSKKKEKEQQNEAYDEYTTILAYLIDEGYATTLNDAMTIVENMSDEWIINILNECN